MRHDTDPLPKPSVVYAALEQLEIAFGDHARFRRVRDIHPTTLETDEAARPLGPHTGMFAPKDHQIDRRVERDYPHVGDVRVAAQIIHRAPWQANRDRPPARH